MSTNSGGSTNQDQSIEASTKNMSSAVGASPKGSANDPFSSNLSPDNASNQNATDEVCGIIKSNNGSSNSITTGSGGGVGHGSGEGNVGTPIILRQNSANSINSCLATSSPNNNNANDSNSSNVSVPSNFGQGQKSVVVDGAAVDLISEDIKKKKSSVKEEDGGKIVSEKSSSVGAIIGGGGNASLNAAIKEEPADLLGSLVNMKKEENLSPNMSPGGFGSIVGPGSVQDRRSVTPVKMELNQSNGGSVNNNNNNTDKSSAVLGLNSDDMIQCNAMNSDILNEASTNGPGPGPGGITSAGIIGGCGPNFQGGGNGSGSTLSNCLDYMQQQNHIFVFSTQLANKAAESVLNGQFQTIIAYHCTQPATKNFLEDFFMKNPMKMNKLQRQNSLGICNMSPGQSWMPVTGISSSGTKVLLQQSAKPSNGGVSKVTPSQFNLNTPENTGKVAGVSRTTISLPANFGDPSIDTMGVTENEILCWDAANRNSLESGTNESQQAIKIQDTGITSGIDTVSGSIESNIISLQGVKVPDENLTPQQRQHREEQLAKLKKMNQFLFPENESDLSSGSASGNANGTNNIPSGLLGNQIGKLPIDNQTLPNIMIQSNSRSGSAMLNSQLRQQIPSNILSQKSEHLQAGALSEEVLLPENVLSDMGSVMACHSVPKAVGGGAAAGSSVMAVVGNNTNIHGSVSGGNGSGSELIGSFSGCAASSVDIVIKGMANQGDGLPIAHSGIGMAQMEWSKIQQQFFEERLKGNKTGCRPLGVPVMGAAPPPPNQNQSQQSMRSNMQGPPPPYHPTQRSASVPIATQSPNPSSPNNPTSNMSLPSPRTAGNLVMPSSSPNIETTATGNSNTNTTVPMCSSSSASANPLVSLSTTSKSSFQTEVTGATVCRSGSPSSNRHRSCGAGGGNGPNTVMTHLNSNPSTPLSHLSPKELESFTQQSASVTGDIKNTRPSPQRSRSPGCHSATQLIEASSLEPRFPASSPGLIFNTHIQSSSNPASNTYKGLPLNNSMERQSSGSGLVPQSGAMPSGGPVQVQFPRRTENLPLNPINSNNRPPQNKIAQNFDPISSLAQMSQQLTSCVSGVGSPAGGLNMMSGGGSTDINMTQGLEHGMMSGLENNSLDHIASGMGTGGSGSAGIHNSCHPNTHPHPMNPLINSIGQRMLNPKMCGANSGFNIGPNGVLRDGPVPGPGSNYHGIMPSARMMGRMPVNFGPNFNPNIQVKASTPNTIQYMPVRPQNSNNNGNNVRMPPSLEFLQRYANPSGGGSGSIDGGIILGGPGSGQGPGPVNAMNSPSDQQNKTVNNSGGGGNSSGMNFFQNCNQLGGLDDEVNVNVMANTEMGVGMGMGMGLGIGQQTMIRGMRPTPHGMRQHGLGSRFQAPSGLDCSDPTVMFNSAASGPCGNASGIGGAPMFAVSQQAQKNSQQQQHMKSIQCNSPSEIAQPMMGVGTNNNNLIPVAASGIHGHPSGGGSGPGVGNPNFKSFVGPSSNDLKYAQQYHSFQQQLYATNTRSQQHPQSSTNMNSMSPNLSPNPAFYINK